MENALQMFIHLDSYQFRMGLTPTYFGINITTTWGGLSFLMGPTVPFTT